MKKKQYVVAGVLGAIALFGGSTAAALAAGFGPGQLPASVLSGFTQSQQDAIAQAEQIRSEANTKAEAVLTAAGVTQEQLHTAMDTYRSAQHKEMDTSLANNDYAAFQSLVAGTPMADKVTSDVFAKLVQAYKLDQSGDHAGAMEIRKALSGAGFGFGGHGGRGGRSGHEGTPSAASATATSS